MYARWERRIIVTLIVLFVVSFGVLIIRFYYGNTELVAAEGGTYIEGSVGSLQPLNPWFTVTNDVNLLINSGLIDVVIDATGKPGVAAMIASTRRHRADTSSGVTACVWHPSPIGGESLRKSRRLRMLAPPSCSGCAWKRAKVIE